MLELELLAVDVADGDVLEVALGAAQASVDGRRPASPQLDAVVRFQNAAVGVAGRLRFRNRTWMIRHRHLVAFTFLL